MIPEGAEDRTTVMEGHASDGGDGTSVPEEGGNR